MPAFSTAKVRDMFDDMVDICDQMVKKWERCVPLRAPPPAPPSRAFASTRLTDVRSSRAAARRFGPRATIDPVEDFTRLAFDTITLCAMNYR